MCDVQIGSPPCVPCRSMRGAGWWGWLTPSWSRLASSSLSSPPYTRLSPPSCHMVYSTVYVEVWEERAGEAGWPPAGAGWPAPLSAHLHTPGFRLPPATCTVSTDTFKNKISILFEHITRVMRSESYEYVQYKIETSILNSMYVYKSECLFSRIFVHFAAPNTRVIRLLQKGRGGVYISSRYGRSQSQHEIQMEQEFYSYFQIIKLKNNAVYYTISLRPVVFTV